MQAQSTGLAMIDSPMSRDAVYTLPGTTWVARGRMAVDVTWVSGSAYRKLIARRERFHASARAIAAGRPAPAVWRSPRTRCGADWQRRAYVELMGFEPRTIEDAMRSRDPAVTHAEVAHAESQWTYTGGRKGDDATVAAGLMQVWS